MYVMYAHFSDPKLDNIKEREIYSLALKEGKSKPCSVRILLVGAENAGKTCLIESLLGEDFKSHGATQGADINVCRIFATNWSRLKNDQVIERLRNQFLSRLKASVERQLSGEIETPDGDEPSSSTPEHEEEALPISTMDGESIQPCSSASLSLRSIDEDGLPPMSDDDVRGAEQSVPVSEDEINAVIWDVSGQTVYHGLLSPFLTEDNVTVIVFNASQDLNSVPRSRSDDEFTESSISPKMKGCDAICYWFNSIYSCCHKSTKSALSRYLPTVFLVATHIDLIGDSKAVEQRKKEIIRLLAKAFEGKPFAMLLAGNCGDDGIEEALKKYCFFVSNKDRDLSVFIQLKEALQQASQHLLNQKHPVAYIKIEGHLLNLDKDSITTSEFIDIACECGFPVNLGSKKFYSALSFLHSKGIALNFQSIDSLKDVLILSPQWLAKLVAYAIVGHPFKKHGLKLDKQYDCLINSGLLHKEFFDYMVKCFNNSCCSGVKINPKQAIDFATSFNFVAEIDTDILNNIKCYAKMEKPADNLYIVTSMLPEEIPKVGLLFLYVYHSMVVLYVYHSTVVLYIGIMKVWGFWPKIITPKPA